MYLNECMCVYTHNRHRLIGLEGVYDIYWNICKNNLQYVIQQQLVRVCIGVGERDYVAHINFQLARK